VFAVKESLVCHFVRHDEATEVARALGIDPPFDSVEFDFVLKPDASRRHL
jgi:hypothetical protein